MNRVEYRAIKEPNQEIDYIIRYYPGPGAKESNNRIQDYIRSKRNRRNRRFASTDKQGNGALTQLQNPLALSVVTATHHQLIVDLIVRFRINPIKATYLVLRHLESVTEQIEAWPFRQTRPRNLAGWMIQAIESKYDLPDAYWAYKTKGIQDQAAAVGREKIAACALCDDNGFRYVFTDHYPNGAMRQCSHDPRVEAKFSTSPDALESPPRDDFSVNEKGPAEVSASP